jgi:hypothetical protein
MGVPPGTPPSATLPPPPNSDLGPLPGQEPGVDPAATPGATPGVGVDGSGIKVGPDGAPLDVRGDVPGRSDLSYDHEPLRKGEDGAMYSADGHKLALTRDGIGYYDVDAYNDGNPKNDLFYTKDGVKVGAEGDVLAHRKADGELINPRTGETIEGGTAADGAADSGSSGDDAGDQSDGSADDASDNPSGTSGGADDGGADGGADDGGAGNGASSNEVTFDEDGVPRGADGERLRPIGDPADPTAWVDREDRIFSTEGELLAERDTEDVGTERAGLGDRDDVLTVAMGDQSTAAATDDRASTPSGPTVQVGADDEQVTVEVTGQDGERSRQSVVVDDSGSTVVTVDGRQVSIPDPVVPILPRESEQVIRA